MLAKNPQETKQRRRSTDARGSRLLSQITLAPRASWQQLRHRIHELVWPTEEETKEYFRILNLMEHQFWLERARSDGSAPSKQARPPHTMCPCSLCGKYWQGFYSRR